jgi:hypothetical protein
MPQAIYILPGSNLHRTNVELYERHRSSDDGRRRCAACGEQHPCQVRRFATTVILASGENPRWYDEHALPTQALPVEAPTITISVAAPTPTFAGYPVGDDRLRAAISHETYER